MASAFETCTGVHALLTTDDTGNWSVNAPIQFDEGNGDIIYDPYNTWDDTNKWFVAPSAWNGLSALMYGYMFMTNVSGSNVYLACRQANSSGTAILTSTNYKNVAGETFENHLLIIPQISTGDRLYCIADSGGDTSATQRGTSTAYGCSFSLIVLPAIV